MYSTPNRPHHRTVNILGALRTLVPERVATPSDALHLAEQQAMHFLAMLHDGDGPVRSDLLLAVPRLRVVRADLPVSGTTHWNGKEWIIALNASEPHSRRRFTLMHEFKHILDHGRTRHLYHDAADRSAAEQAEQAADYFAGCVLIPRQQLQIEWAAGNRTAPRLAKHFRVSVPAIRMSLAQAGLIELSHISATLPTAHRFSTHTEPLGLTPIRSKQ